MLTKFPQIMVQPCLWRSSAQVGFHLITSNHMGEMKWGVWGGGERAERRRWDGFELGTVLRGHSLIFILAKDCPKLFGI